MPDWVNISALEFNNDSMSDQDLRDVLARYILEQPRNDSASPSERAVEYYFSIVGQDFTCMRNGHGMHISREQIPLLRAAMRRAIGAPLPDDGAGSSFFSRLVPEGYLARTAVNASNKELSYRFLDGLWKDIRQQLMPGLMRGVRMKTGSLSEVQYREVNVRGTELRVSYAAQKTPVTEYTPSRLYDEAGPYVWAMFIGVHEDDAPKIAQLARDEDKMAQQKESSMREVAQLLTIELVRLQGSELFLAYEKGGDAVNALPQSFRNLGIAMRKWASDTKSTLHTPESAIPALCRYFHVLPPVEKFAQERAAYLSNEQVATQLKISASDRDFTRTWNALEKEMAKAIDGKPIPLGSAQLDVVASRRGAMLIPYLHQDDLDKFRQCMQQADLTSFQLSIPIPPKRGGRR